MIKNDKSNFFYNLINGLFLLSIKYICQMEIQREKAASDHLKKIISEEKYDSIYTWNTLNKIYRVLALIFSVFLN